MRVTLSWAWTGDDGEQHTVGDTVDVDDATGKQLVRDGHATVAAADQTWSDMQAAATAAATATYQHETALDGDAADEDTDTADADAGEQSPARPTTKSPDEGDNSEGVS